jgi:hypothetical protein
VITVDLISPPPPNPKKPLVLFRPIVQQLGRGMIEHEVRRDLFLASYECIHFLKEGRVYVFVEVIEINVSESCSMKY